MEYSNNLKKNEKYSGKNQFDDGLHFEHPLIKNKLLFVSKIIRTLDFLKPWTNTIFKYFFDIGKY